MRVFMRLKPFETFPNGETMKITGAIAEYGVCNVLGLWTYIWWDN
jgi:hypothetical protein